MVQARSCSARKSSYRVPGGHAILDDDDDDDDALVHSVEHEAVVQSMPQVHGSISGAAGGQGPSDMPALTSHGSDRETSTLGPIGEMHICVYGYTNMNK